MNDNQISAIEAKAVENALNAASQMTKQANRIKVFIGLPNMTNLNAGLVSKMFLYAQSQEFEPWFHILPEKRHVDFARNELAKLFLSSKCDYFCMIDHDVDPHANLLSLIHKGKDISSGLVFCWIHGQLMPSIWERAECEQCKNVEMFVKTGEAHDKTQYVVNGDVLFRWNPFSCNYTKFATREGRIDGLKCRCLDSGIDPWVFRVHKGVIGEQPLQKVDSVGAAAMIISRKVIEQIHYPWFRFLYKENGEILLTEDHYFCWKAQAHGFEVWADPQMACSHYKTVDLLQVNAAVNNAYQFAMKQMEAKSAIVIPTEQEIAAVVK